MSIEALANLRSPTAAQAHTGAGMTVEEAAKVTWLGVGLPTWYIVGGAAVGLGLPYMLPEEFNGRDSVVLGARLLGLGATGLGAYMTFAK